KVDILDYLNSKKIPYLIDPTNEQMTYLRNRIRAKVLPALQECDQRFHDNFLATITRLQETEEYLELETVRIYNQITIHNAEKRSLKLDSFLQLHHAMQQRILIYWLIQHKIPFTPSQSLLQEIIRFFNNPAGGSHIIHPSWHIIKKQNIASVSFI